MFFRSTLRRICVALVFSTVVSSATVQAQLVNIDGFTSNGSGRAVSDLRVSQRGANPTTATLGNKPLLTEDNFKAGRGLEVIKNGNITYRINDDVMRAVELAHYQNTDIGTTSTNFAIDIEEIGDNRFLFFGGSQDYYLGFSTSGEKFRFSNSLEILGDVASIAGVFTGNGSGLTNIVLNQLSDVVISSATAGQVLTYNGTQWVNDTPASSVPPSRTISTNAPLSGGGDLSANRTLSISKATSSVDGYLSSADWSLFNGKVDSTRSISAGTGLTGGGNLSADRTLSIDTAVVPRLNANNSFTGTNNFDGEINIVDNGNSPKIMFDNIGYIVHAAGSEFQFSNQVTAPSFDGNGSGLTSLNASNLASGTVNDARLPSSIGRIKAKGTAVFNSGDITVTNANIAIGDICIVSYQYDDYSAGPLTTSINSGSVRIHSQNPPDEGCSVNWMIIKGD